MKKILHGFNRTLQGSFLTGLLFIFLFSTSAATGTSWNSCTDTGSWYNNLDCGIIIILDNGLKISDPDYPYPEILANGLRVRVGYELIDATAPVCGDGFIVNITCFEILDPGTDCQAKFVAYPLDISGEDGTKGWYPYQFVDISGGDIVKRYWFIDGDSISDDETIEYLFTEEGQHSVCLSILTAEGCHDTECKDIYIGEHPPCQADFVYHPENVFLLNSDESSPYVAGYPYVFKDNSYGDVISWTWMVGDEVFEGGPEFFYVFPEPGAYGVCLTIMTADGCSSVACKDVIVDTMPYCMAEFEYYAPLDLDSGFTDFPGSRVIQFVDQSWGDVISWHWDFGDGSSSVEQNPIHEFPYPGEFQVCLFISTTSGCEDIHCESVFIDTTNYNCHAQFDYCSYTYPAYDPAFMDKYIIGFRNLSTPNTAYSWWEFGDGTWSDERNPVHVYSAPGIYNVCLTIYTPDGCYDGLCQEIYVGVDSCHVDFTHDIIVPDCEGFNVAHLFLPVTSEEAGSYFWDFGDGTTYYGKEAAHMYASEGYFTVCLEAWYQNGCSAKKCKTVYNYQEVNDSVYYEKCSPHGIPVMEDISVQKAYPVPASDLLYLEIYSQSDATVNVQLINVLGQATGLNRDYKVTTGTHTLELQLDNIETGTYLYRITSVRGTAQGRVSVIR